MFVDTGIKVVLSNSKLQIGPAFSTELDSLRQNCHKYSEGDCSEMSFFSCVHCTFHDRNPFRENILRDEGGGEYHCHLIVSAVSQRSVTWHIQVMSNSHQ